MPSQKPDIVHVVIWVHSGVPYAVEAYRDEAATQTRADFFKRDINPDYDEVGVFEVEMRS